MESFTQTERRGPTERQQVSRRGFLGWAGLGVMACGSGCHLREWADNGFKVGPNYGRPEVYVADEWIDGRNEHLSVESPDLAEWWRVLNDAKLDALIESAYEGNLTLRVAGARVLEARYLRRIAVGGLFPQQQDVRGSYSANKNSRDIAFVPPQTWFENWDVGLNITWEIDFWGRFRRTIEAADAQLDASVEAYDEALVLLLGEIATAYVELRTFQARLDYARQNVASQEQALTITESKYKFGAATERDVQQARTVLEQTRALIPKYQAGMRLAGNRLCVLRGEPPRDLLEELGELPIPSVPPTVAVGIPADLVRRRPDVRRAEREVAAQSARVGIAETDLYPHIALNGTFGVAAEDFGRLFDGQRSTFGGIGPSFRWDLLHYGRLVNRIRAQDAKFESFVYEYQQIVLQAGREAEDSIVVFLRGQEELLSVKASATAAKRTLDITFDQYKQGAVDFTAVFIASSVLATRQDALAEVQGRVTQALIKIYQTLGGGWEMRLTREEQEP